MNQNRVECLRSFIYALQRALFFIGYIKVCQQGDSHNTRYHWVFWVVNNPSGAKIYVLSHIPM